MFFGCWDDPNQPGGGVFLVWNSGKGLRNGSMSYEYVGRYMNDAVWIDCGPGPGQQTKPQREQIKPQRETVSHQPAARNPAKDAIPRS